MKHLPSTRRCRDGIASMSNISKPDNSTSDNSTSGLFTSGLFTQRTVVLAVLTGLTLGLSACGGGGGTTTTRTSTLKTTTVPSTISAGGAVRIVSGQPSTEVPTSSSEVLSLPTATMAGSFDAMVAAARARPKQGSISQSSRVSRGVTSNTVQVSSQINSQGNADFNVRELLQDGSQGFQLDTGSRSTSTTVEYKTYSTYKAAFVETKYEGGTLWLDIYSTVESSRTDYLAGGVWLWMRDNPSGREHYQFGVFGDMPDDYVFDKDKINGLSGTAEYAGKTSGIYSQNTGAETFKIGYFDANVALTANFDTDRISGTVTKDNSAAESDMFPVERVTLDAADIDATKDGGFFTGNTSGEGDLSGKWGGQFFGKGDSPDGVAGTFGAANDTYSILGAYGAFASRE